MEKKNIRRNFLQKYVNDAIISKVREDKIASIVDARVAIRKMHEYAKLFNLDNSLVLNAFRRVNKNVRRSRNVWMFDNYIMHIER